MSKKSSIIRSDGKKRELLNEHFFYEFMMMRGILICYNSLKNIALTYSKNLVFPLGNNICVEETLLHARNLLEFFYYDDISQDKASASEFMKKGVGWDRIRPDKTKLAGINIVQKRVDCELAHLTYRRIAGTPPEKSFNFMQIYKDFKEVVDIFLANIDPKYSDKNIEKLKGILHKENS
ncbi:MAG: hypothetical protein KKE96_04640 [Candidatus Altiarchaeota archaeon]|nr:hypothetical protein [Candidatus Altiarchaeota archaeon]